MKYILLSLIGFALMNISAPTKKSEMASTLYDGKMYIPGGINFWWSNDGYEAYDIKNDTWETLPDLPHDLNHMGLSAFEGKVYMSGGFHNARQTKFSNKLYVYDIQKKTWDLESTMPGDRGAHYMITRDHYLHLIGGRLREEVWSYNLKTKKWETDIIAPIPAKRDHITVLQTEDKLYLVGGRHIGAIREDCWVYDFVTNKWSTFTQLPSARGGQSACLHNNKIHVAGGEDLDKGITYSRHDVYDIQSNTWSVGQELKIARHGFVSELYEGKWYIFGGGKKAGVKTLISTTADMEIMDL